MNHTVERVEMVRLLQANRIADEGPGTIILRALRNAADVKSFVERLEVVFAPSLHWSGPDIITIIKRECGAR